MSFKLGTLIGEVPVVAGEVPFAQLARTVQVATTQETPTSMEPFETLGKQDMATAVSKRFAIGRNTVLSATVESMKAAWKAGDKTLLRNASGNPLQGSQPQPQGGTQGTQSATSEQLAQAIAQAVAELGTVGMDEERVKVLAREVATEVFDDRTPDLLKRLEAQSVKELVVKVNDLPKKEMGKQHERFADILTLVGLRLNVWMAGPAGAGKSFMAAEVARALERPFFRISCGPQTAASQIFGHTTAHGGYAPGIAYQALTHEKGAILLFDEFDRLNPAVAVMVNGLLDGGAVTFPNGETLLPRPQTTYLVAANTFGKPTADFGTAQRQDAATMSRFVKVLIPVDEKLETSVFGNNDWVRFVQKVRRIVVQLGITSLVVTPRASEYGVRMLEGGLSRKVVEDTLLWAGIPQEDVAKIKANLSK